VNKLTASRPGSRLQGSFRVERTTAAPAPAPIQNAFLSEIGAESGDSRRNVEPTPVGIGSALRPYWYCQKRL